MNTLLMCEDTIVLQFNVSDGVYNIVRKDLLPFRLKDALQFYTVNESASVQYNAARLAKCMENNSDIIMDWLSRRTLLLSRKNAKKLFNAFALPQLDDRKSRARLAIMCKAISILDNYWLKPEGSSLKWDKINLRHNSLSEAIAQIALHGSTPFTIDGSIENSYEFLTNGASAKCWKRRDDGNLWMLKAGDNGTFEAKVEVSVSNILDRCNVSHCHYEGYYDNDLFVSACPAMTNDDLSIVDGDNFISYCNRHDLDYVRELLRIDSDSYYKMMIVDYLIANRDRHTQNWGLYYNPKTTELISMHPLFDHNNAFDVDCMQNEDFKSHFGDKSLKDNALNAMKHCDFHFTNEITRDLFVTQRHYDCFMWRAEQLGIRLKKDSVGGMFKKAEGK